MSETEEKKPEPEATTSEDGAATQESATQEPNAELIGQFEAGFDEIKTMAAELGTKLGSAATDVSAEAKETWKKMEPQVKEKLKTAEATLGVATEAASEQLKGIFGELKGSLKSLKDKL